MPKINIDYETLDSMALLSLQDMLEATIDAFRTCHHDDKHHYKEAIDALQKVIALYD